MNMYDESKLLLCCTQTKPSKAELDELVKFFKLPLNWDKILKFSFRQGITPLLYYNLAGLQRNQSISHAIMEQLKGAYDRGLARNMLLYTELHRILRKFQEKGVEVIVLKGAALAETVYSNIALRTFGDLDLLVRKDNLPYVEKLMSDLTYYCTSPGKNSQQRFRKNHFHAAPYVNSDKLTVVDIHWHVTNHGGKISIDEWWKRAKKAKIAGQEVLVLSPEHILIHLCLHLFNHGYHKSRLRVLCDIFETLRYYKNEFDWATFREEVNDYGINKLVYSVMYLVKNFHWNKSNFPSWLDPTVVPIDLRLVALIEGMMLTENENNSRIPVPIVQILAVDKFQDKIRILLNRTFPPRELLSDRYSAYQSSKTLYLSYLVRPFKLFLKYRKSIFETFSGKKIHQ